VISSSAPALGQSLFFARATPKPSRTSAPPGIKRAASEGRHSFAEAALFEVIVSKLVVRTRWVGLLLENQLKVDDGLVVAWRRRGPTA